ncbi:MAG TPA: TIM barrel protein [Steroidobacteraceae bacterium]|nr:TIM barrel protein [Steroidobacteraceae bacterium]
MLRFCANVSWLFCEVPFLERPEAARRAGFSGIEFHSAEGHTARQIAQAASDADVSIALFNAWPGDFLEGGPGLSGVPGRESEFRRVVQQACEFGAVIGGASVQIGQSRVPAGVSREECMQVYVENIGYAAAALAQAGCRVLVEPMNETDWPGVLVRDVPTALAAIAEIGDPSIGLQFDTYHHCMSGAATDAAAIGALVPRIAHLQFSDAPGRHEPGTGRIDFDALFQALERHAYPHWVAAEYRPSRPTLETLGWLK